MASQNWMICFDGSSFADAAIDWALDLLKTSKPQHLEMHILSVLQPTSSIAGLAGPFGGAASAMAVQSALHDEEEHAWQARKLALKHLQDRFLAIGVRATAHLRRATGINEEIIKVAKELRVDTLIVGARGLSGLKSLVLGSVSDHLVHNAPCTVIVAREPVNHEASDSSAAPAAAASSE